MSFAYPMQKMQDWLTQQWVILSGRKIDPREYPWLIGPFGLPDVMGEDFVYQLAEKEKLVIEKDIKWGGLISSMDSLALSEAELSKLSLQVIDFYENTAKYDLHFSIKWNPLFKGFGVLISSLFGSRLRQLHIPTKNSNEWKALKSEVINLIDGESNERKYTCWLRSMRSGGQTIYSGIYGTGVLPSGKTCIKAVFPLPNGNATVLMTPAVGKRGELILESSGNKFGDAGFYFLLQDAKGEYWAKYIRSFRDHLIVQSEKGKLSAEQILTLWHKEVLRFSYKMEAY